MNTNHLILLNRLKSFDGLSKDQLTGIYAAMNDCAVTKIGEYRNREIKSVSKSGIKLLFSMKWDNVILWLRRKSFNLAKKNAQIRANIENRKVYVIRDSQIGYTLLSTLDVDKNRRLRILGKDVDALKLAATADYVAMPEMREL